MKRVLAMPVRHGHYTAAECFVWCFDDRFYKLFATHVGVSNFERIDALKVAGGAKDLAAEIPNAGTAYLLDQLDKSFLLHKPASVGLMVHTNCGAYGKLPKGTDEVTFLTEELHRAHRRVQEFLTVRNYKARVRTYIADFDGLLEVFFH